MNSDYQCDGCGTFYDLNSYGGASTCNNCGGQIQLLRNEAETYSVYLKQLKPQNVIEVVSVGKSLTKEEAEKLKESKIKERLDGLRKRLEDEYYIQKD
jgi:hypothetical protein